MTNYRNRKRTYRLIVVNAVSVAVLLLVLSGCSYIGMRNPWTDPKPLFLQTDLDYGPEEFRQAYSDGCHTALSAYGNSYQKTVYGLRKDPKYQDSQMYNQVWKDAWNFCYKWIFAYNREPDNLF